MLRLNPDRILADTCPELPTVPRSITFIPIYARYHNAAGYHMWSQSSQPCCWLTVLNYDAILLTVRTLGLARVYFCFVFQICRGQHIFGSDILSYLYPVA